MIYHFTVETLTVAMYHGKLYGSCDLYILQDSERFLSRSQDLEHQLSTKEKELEILSNKQKRVGHNKFLCLSLNQFN